MKQVFGILGSFGCGVAVTVLMVWVTLAQEPEPEVQHDPGTLTLSTSEIEIVWEGPQSESTIDISDQGDLWLDVDGHIVSRSAIKKSIDRAIIMYGNPDIHRKLKVERPWPPMAYDLRAGL